MTFTMPGEPTASVTTSSTGGAPAAPLTTSSPGTSGQTTVLFFDAVLRAEHNQELVLTKHPVQVGPAIVDHAYLLPARVMLDILMSDAADSYTAGQYSGDPSKSVAAFAQFLSTQATRIPITLATRLKAYQNMAITDVRAQDDSRTAHALKCTLYFEQIISASTTTATQSARPDQTGATNEGTKSTDTLDPVTSSIINGMGAFPSTPSQ
jgi:hypothetical protein